MNLLRNVTEKNRLGSCTQTHLHRLERAWERSGSRRELRLVSGLLACCMQLLQLRTSIQRSSLRSREEFLAEQGRAPAKMSYLLQRLGCWADIACTYE